MDLPQNDFRESTKGSVPYFHLRNGFKQEIFFLLNMSHTIPTHGKCKQKRVEGSRRSKSNTQPIQLGKDGPLGLPAPRLRYVLELLAQVCVNMVCNVCYTHIFLDNRRLLLTSGRRLTQCKECGANNSDSGVIAKQHPSSD